jgi:FkbM family methyltransferase
MTFRRLLHGIRRRFNLLLAHWMAGRGFDVHPCLPAVTLSPLDLLLAAYAVGGQKITIFQVGACDGVGKDPVHRYVARGFCRAILIEPNPAAFSSLQKTYDGVPNVTLVQCAIAERDGEAWIYRPRVGIVDWRLQITSFYREHLIRHGLKPHQIERIAVPCRSLSSLAAELGIVKIDLLQIDVEGFDAAVVRMALKLPVPPDCINFEVDHLTGEDRKPLFELLETCDYLLGNDGHNVLAVRTSLMLDSLGGENHVTEEAYSIPSR